MLWHGTGIDLPEAVSFLQASQCRFGEIATALAVKCCRNPPASGGPSSCFSAGSSTGRAGAHVGRG